MSGTKVAKFACISAKSAPLIRNAKEMLVLLFLGGKILIFDKTCQKSGQVDFYHGYIKNSAKAEILKNLNDLA